MARWSSRDVERALHIPMSFSHRISPNKELYFGFSTYASFKLGLVNASGFLHKSLIVSLDLED